jgi:hypothetical protein
MTKMARGAMSPARRWLSMGRALTEPVEFAANGLNKVESQTFSWMISEAVGGCQFFFLDGSEGG